MRELGDCLERVKSKEPLILSITNLVTINECANALLAIGASPVMSNDPKDAESLAAMAAATLLNIGTINPKQLEVLLAAGRGALTGGHPVLFDPVGAGATQTRREAAARILESVRITALKGNLAEIKALSDLDFVQKGVDSTEADDPVSVAALAESLAQSLETSVVVTGAVDVISNGRHSCFIEGGSPLLSRMTGAGCLLGAMISAYVGANPEPERLLFALAAAVSHLALAGERAASALSPPGALGSFRVGLFDQLSLISTRALTNFKGIKFK